MKANITSIFMVKPIQGRKIYAIAEQLKKCNIDNNQVQSWARDWADLKKKLIKDEGFDLVSGWKKKRYDPFVKRITSKFYNRTARWSSGIKLHDFNCGLKAYKNEVVKSIEVFGEMHRYIPMLAKEAGFKK